MSITYHRPNVQGGTWENTENTDISCRHHFGWHNLRTALQISPGWVPFLNLLWGTTLLSRTAFISLALWLAGELKVSHSTFTVKLFSLFHYFRTFVQFSKLQSGHIWWQLKNVLSTNTCPIRYCSPVLNVFCQLEKLFLYCRINIKMIQKGI